ncbi:MAG: hypothetical protein Q7K98_00355 [Candidatus Omnitrophota bacterium]|nr:hypothetical protein [Candidatus Omnitrophota bacterium]
METVSKGKMDKGTSDERLLKIIEGGTGEIKRKPSIGVSPKKSLSELIPTHKFGLNLKDIKEFKFNLPLLNKVLVLTASVVTLFLIYSLLSGPVVSASNAAYFTSTDAAAISKVISSRENQGILRKNVLPQDIKRDIFLPPGVKPIESVETDGPKVAELTKDLKLVGIIWSANPEVMIEYGKDPNSRTYVLKKGDSFENEQFKIKEVSRNSATLEISSGGKTSDYELR